MGTRNANLLKLKQPETIRKLETDMFGPQLTPFKGVECLVTKETRVISKATIHSLPKLKELRYNTYISSFFWNYDHRNGTFDGVRRALSELVEEAKQLRGSDFQFNLSGFQLTKVDVHQIDFGLPVHEEHTFRKISNEYVYMKNYHLIEPGALQFFYYVEYNHLLGHVTGEFPRCFSQKFTGIEQVQAWDKIEDPDHFLWFLSSLKSLNYLSLNSPGLSQEFFDKLPASVGWLESLSLSRLTDRLNFDFIGDLSLLSYIKISEPLSPVSAASLVKSSAKLANQLAFECSFYVQLNEAPQIGRHWEVSIKKGSAEWKVFESYELRFATENAQKLAKWLTEGWSRASRVLRPRHLTNKKCS